MSKLIKRFYSSTAHASSKLSALRAAMNHLDAVLIPSEDAHQSEYTAECDNRRAWLSGFTGSAGCAIVTKKEALLFTDGRYFIQASNELDNAHWKLMKQGLPGVPTWQEYIKQVPSGSTIGIDPTVINAGEAKELEKELSSRGSKLIYTDNLVDRIRPKRPSRPREPIKTHPLQYAGQSVESKLKALCQSLKGKNMVISRLDEIAWLLNLRGSDIHCCPVFFSYCVVTPTGTLLYLQSPETLSDAVKAHLKENNITLKPYDAITHDLSTYSSSVFSVDPEGTNMSIIKALGSNEIHWETSPIQLSKAVKNEAEMSGMIDCHKRDAVALCKHFAWLSDRLCMGEKVWEYEAVEQLESMRQLDPLYVGPSFDTIAASGPNGAIVHYAQASDVIDPHQIYLCDSGAHYLNGTTDITRTWLFQGEPSSVQKQAFTRVLQAHISIDQAVFPQGTTGYQLDSVARLPLWKHGMDFKHGVGHGVGAYLNVHEGPHGIGGRIGYSKVPLQAGMVVTNEPGYYKDLQFGIRIENVLRVCKSVYDQYLCFKHLTWVPLGIKLIDSQLLDKEQRDWNSVKRDQLILYRIIGNDLPPRHKEGQTLSNLQFILDHEPPFPNTRKIFLLNRISDPANEAAIVRLLDQHQMEYIRVPFDEKEYEQLDFQLESFPDSDFLHSDDYRRYSKVAKLRILDFMYHTKNLYAMNNNGGRNTAIQHGKSIENAQWILPFDGNCYLSYNGFKEITEQLEKHGKDTKYFIVPMTRLLNNSILLNNLDQRPKAPEEPQIIFRYDAKEEYNLNMRYGRRSKLELLWRLGALESRQLNRPTVPWEPVGRPYSDEKGNFKNIGWVFRLFSGNPQQEENKKEASSIRAFNRLKAIQSTLDSLDEKIARRRFGHERLFLYSDEEMNEIRFEYWSKNPEVTATVTRLEQVAEKVLEENQMRPSTTQDHVKMDPDRDILAGLSQNVTILTLANYFLGNEKYGQGAANLIRMHFLNEYEPMRGDLLDFLSDQGYAFPNRQVSRKYSRHRTLNTSDLTRTDLSSLLDCIRLLRRREWLTHREYVDLQATMAEFLEYLITSPTGIHLAQMSDYRGVLYDLQVTSMAAFTDDVRLFLRVANRCRMRIGKGFKMTYVDDKEDWRVQFHYTTLSLQYWTSLARGIQHSRAAKEIWHYTAANGNRISHAVVDHLQSHLDLLPSLSSSEAQFVKSRLRPLAHTALAVFRQAQSVSGTEEDWAWLERHVGAFGSQWDKEQKDQGRVQGMLKFIRSEMKKGRSGLPPFWMLTVFN